MCATLRRSHITVFIGGYLLQSIMTPLIKERLAEQTIVQHPIIS